ncbi:organoarsenical effux MFS transporter ArsJ [Persicirhabdus sediminis]|uniref:Organoarsenical effux MFS transporter ArsJ n=1 Tax=Persicirhabdus sediminis TaxID=454144 RepID=A0A8J7MI19_9BACT|nr:organoarsenical effux MFS transporter ArsJ [Persicirhabdus sediminis]MBK1792364.1 organoarsenical effux MFS transporter ArsJ [Persicirhabdus sediminis]
MLKNYAIVTGAYWSFMLTDGALRMLVLLYFHELGYSPLTLAMLFLLYEFFGIVTNLFGGWLATRCGLKSTLVGGLVLQSLAMVMLSQLDTSWPEMMAVAYVMASQALSGIAKDLTKMSSKTAIKFLIPEDQSSSLFKWVSALTGSKNAIKGIGFFVGAALLSWFGFANSLWIMAAGIFTVLISSIVALPQEIGRAKSKPKLQALFSQGRDINWLSFSRIFLFGARDIWFVVGLPIFLTSQLDWDHPQTGTFMASWVIAYGIVQAFAPKIIKNRLHGKAPDGKTAIELAGFLLASMVAMIIALQTALPATIAIIGGLFIFGAIFALNSSVHSFLILEYADGDKAAMNVGFYYMANAMGRLLGTLLSGLLFQLGGLNACLIGSATFLLVTTLSSFKLPRHAS